MTTTLPDSVRFCKLAVETPNSTSSRSAAAGSAPYADSSAIRPGSIPCFSHSDTTSWAWATVNSEVEAIRQATRSRSAERSIRAMQVRHGCGRRDARVAQLPQGVARVLERRTGTAQLPPEAGGVEPQAYHHNPGAGEVLVGAPACPLSAALGPPHGDGHQVTAGALSGQPLADASTARLA